jgi:hypothetical protein
MSSGSYIYSLKSWIKIGAGCGLLVSIIYPSIIFVPLPLQVQVVLVALFGPLLGLASLGLYYFLRLDKESITSKVGLFSNIIAGMLVTLMLLVQSAIHASKPEVISGNLAWIWTSLNHIHFGIDVTWDIYIAIGTLFFAISMINHPRLGLWFSISGIVISVSLFILNIWSFPIPPAGAGSVDVGPLVGLWYLVITVRILLSFKWINQRIEQK